MDKKDWTLLAVSCVNREFISPAQLQKSLFLLSQMKPKAVSSDFYKFIPYNYGPFCQEIYSDVESLIAEGLIITGSPEGQRWVGYAATSKGMEYVNELKNKIAQEDYDYLCEVVKWARSVTFPELISSIYKRFPKFKRNSVFQK